MPCPSRSLGGGYHAGLPQTVCQERLYLVEGPQKRGKRVRSYAAASRRPASAFVLCHASAPGGWNQLRSQQERRASGLCCSTSEGGDVASRIKDASIEGIADDGDQENELSAEEIDRRIRKAAALIATAESLAPFDRRTFNPSLLIW
jgi:hypothetical protein